MSETFNAAKELAEVKERLMALSAEMTKNRRFTADREERLDEIVTELDIIERCLSTPTPSLTLSQVEKAVRDQLAETFITNGLATPGMIEPIIGRVMARLSSTEKPGSDKVAVTVTAADSAGRVHVLQKGDIVTPLDSVTTGTEGVVSFFETCGSGPQAHPVAYVHFFGGYVPFRSGELRFLRTAEQNGGRQINDGTPEHLRPDARGQRTAVPEKEAATP